LIFAMILTAASLKKYETTPDSPPPSAIHAAQVAQVGPLGIFL
jgi:hypothetical protein